MTFSTLKIVLESDGTEVDDNDVFVDLAAMSNPNENMLMLLVGNEKWTPNDGNF